MSQASRADRYQGALLGLAVGDAVGTTLEFSPVASFRPITDMVGGGPFRLNPGQWTDDTSMALCLAESLLEQNGFDGVDQLKRYVRWWRTGYLSSTGSCFDIGTTVQSALRRYEATGTAECGSQDPLSAGNGSIMRLAPVPLFYAAKPAIAVERSADSSKTTHGARTAVDACRYYGGLIVGAVQGRSKEELLSRRFAPAEGLWENTPLVDEIDEVASGSFKDRNPPEIRGTGYVVRSMEAALWAFYTSDTYRDGCLAAANLGEDADTTAAIYGQLAGAFYGVEGIPPSWLAKLSQRELIAKCATRLFEAALPPLAKQT